MNKKQIEDELKKRNIYTEEFLKQTRGKNIDEIVQMLIESSREYAAFILQYNNEHFENDIKELKKTKKKLKIYRIVTNASSVRTKLGDIKYKRTKYKIKNGEDTIESYLFDKFIDVCDGSKYSKATIKMFVHAVVSSSYQEVANNIENFGVNITKQGIWNIINGVIGNRLIAHEKQLTLEFVRGDDIISKDNHQVDKKEIATLFVELDGLFIPIFNKNKKPGLPHKRKELKLGKAFIGWEKRYNSENSDYKTVGTIYASGFEKPEIFKLILEGKINQIYDYHNVQRIILNGDGAKWIFNSFNEDARVICQLDLFHIYQKITTHVQDNSLASKYSKMVKNNKFQDIIDDIEQRLEHSEDEKYNKNLTILQTYLKNNFFALDRFKNKIDFVDVSDDLEVKNLGTIEGSIRNVLAHRMKINAVWSEKGAKVMAMLLCLHREGRLDETLDYILSKNIDVTDDDLEKLINTHYEKVDNEIKNNTKAIKKKVNSKYEHKQSSLHLSAKDIIKKQPAFAKVVKTADGL